MCAAASHIAVLTRADMSIKVTSPTTHMISSAMRGVIQTILGVSLFGDVVTLCALATVRLADLCSGRLCSIALTLAGSILYTWQRDRELQLERTMRGPPSSGLGKRIDMDTTSSARRTAAGEDDVAAATLSDAELDREVDAMLSDSHGPSRPGSDSAAVRGV